MFTLFSRNPMYMDGWIKKLTVTLIWKKKFFTSSYKKIIRSLFNFTIEKKKMLILKKIDFKLYFFFIKFNGFTNSIIIIKLFQLQDESSIIRLIGVLFEKFERNFGTFIISRFVWKNDLRINSNSKFFFETYNSYLNNSINSTINFPSLDSSVSIINKLKERLLLKFCISKSYYFIKIMGKVENFLFKIF